MTGPDHYHEAEKLLDHAFGIEDRGSPEDLSLLAEAQVHATLALAAATAMHGHPEGHIHSYDYTAWDDAAGVK
ncbi:hypothetical protein ABZ845_06870 [Streptomyces sp. NPDC047022]|uniref:hypothetical protein n=1 Tax=Streptomyces sp. NPDC047022 TaxID=3155737 RepID=UPI0033E7B0A4